VDDVDEYDRFGLDCNGWNYKGYTTNTYDADAEFCLDPRDASDVLSMGFRDLTKWVRMSSPEDVAELLMTMAEEMEYRDETTNEEV
jgi:hypothetical protein